MSLCSFKRERTVLWAISWFIKIELKQIYCSNSPNKKIQNGFQSFLLLFLRSILLLNGKKILVMICLFFISFVFPQLLYCSPALPLFWRAWKEAWVKKKHCYHQSTNFETNFPLSYENAQYHQNRRQEVFNKEFLRCAGGLDILQFNKFNWFVVFSTSNGRAWRFVWGGLSPPKLPLWRWD